MAKSCSSCAILLLLFTSGCLMNLVIGGGFQTKDLGLCKAQDDCNSKCSKIHQSGKGVCSSNGGAKQQCLCHINCEVCEINLPVHTLECDEAQCKFDCIDRFPGKEIKSFCINEGSEPIFNSCHCQYCC